MWITECFFVLSSPLIPSLLSFSCLFLRYCKLTQNKYRFLNTASVRKLRNYSPMSFGEMLSEEDCGQRQIYLSENRSWEDGK